MQTALSLAQYLAEQQRVGFYGLREWLEQYEVETFTGWLHVDHADEYGFSLPEREADAIYYYPSPEEEEEDNPYQMPVQCEWWAEEGVLLGIQQILDTVMCCDVFTWYRVPNEAVRQYQQMQESAAGTTAQGGL